MSKEYKLVCSICGKEYIGKSAKFRVCNECRSPISVKCCICNKDIVLSDYQMRKYIKGDIDINNITCSVKCKNERMRNSGFNITCKSCGKLFHTNKAGSMYCEECLSSVDLVCPICNKVFQTNYRQKIKLLKNPNERILCSRSCTVKSGLLSYENRTGYKNPSCNPDVVNRREKNYYNKTGYRSSLSNPDVRDKIEKTVQDKYGVPYACMTESCRNSSSAISKINKYYYEYFDCNGYEKRIGKSSYDLIKGNILIEIDPTYTHNSTNSNRFGEATDKNYQYNKTVLAIENGYRCIHVFDWDNREKVKNILPHDTIRIYARDCIIKDVSTKECDDFLNKYHLQSTVRFQRIRLGLYFQDRLVQIMTFGKPRYNKNYEYELLRLCTDPSYIVIGGSNKLFKNFVRRYDPESIISYCDNAKFTGDVYKKLGMTLDSFGVPTAHWYNCKTGVHITDNQLRRYGFDRLVGSRMNPPEVCGKGTNNEELMISHGFVAVYDVGQSKYVWKKEM